MATPEEIASLLQRGAAARRAGRLDEASRCMNEAMFYGNLFTSPPNGFYALGTDADGVISNGGGSWDVGKIRCDGWGTGQCPYANSGVAYHYYFAWTSDKCDAVNFGLGMIVAPCQGPGAAKACHGNARSFVYTTATNPLTAEWWRWLAHALVDLIGSEERREVCKRREVETKIGTNEPERVLNKLIAETPMLELAALVTEGGAGRRGEEGADGREGCGGHLSPSALRG